MTPREIVAIFKGDQECRTRAHEEARARNFELAALISYAHHSPSKMPEYKPGNTPKSDKPSEVDNERVRGYFIGLAMQTQNRKKAAK